MIDHGQKTGAVHEAEKLGQMLKRYDSVVLPNAFELATLERKILEQVDVLRAPSSRFLVLPAWIQSLRPWAPHGAAMAAIFVTLLGFMAGRNFSDAVPVTSEQAILMASAGSLPWQSFLTESLSSGEVDDPNE